MNKQALIDFLEEHEDEEEVFLKVDDTLYDFTFEQIPECFDGFDTAYPAAIALVKGK